jgi:hypothetical protein
VHAWPVKNIFAKHFGEKIGVFLIKVLLAAKKYHNIGA